MGDDEVGGYTCVSEPGWDGVLSENGKWAMMRWEVTRVYACEPGWDGTLCENGK